MNNDSTYTIGELSEQTGVSRRTIHFYVQQGILPPPAGAGLGARYSVEHRMRLELVPVLRRRGLRLDEIRAQLSGLGPAELERMLSEAPMSLPPAAAPSQGAPSTRAQLRAKNHYALPGGIEVVAPAELAPRRQQQLAALLEKAAQIFKGD